MFARTFLHHPRSVNETYFAHMGFALWFASRLATAAGAALIHAIIPSCCEKTASTIIAELYERTRYRGTDETPANADVSGTATANN